MQIQSALKRFQGRIDCPKSCARRGKTIVNVRSFGFTSQRAFEKFLSSNIVTPVQFDHTTVVKRVCVARQGKLIKKAPTTWYRSDLAKRAVANLKAQGIDVYGKRWKPAVVHVTPGGK